MKPEDIGPLLRTYRKERGYMVPEVHTLLEEQYGLKVSDNTIYNWESNQYNISLPKYLALCELYGISDPPPVPEPSEEKTLTGFPITESEKALLLAYRKNKDLQAAICRMLELPVTPDDED